MLNNSAVERVAFVLLLLALSITTVCAGQTDIVGPPGSGNFGVSVHALPNGNTVIADPTYSSGGVSSIGAVYLYTPDGVLISTVTGSTSGDLVGGGGVTVLKNGDYVISSPNWNNGGVTHAGAVTWHGASATTTTVVSAANSVVGTHASDQVGLNGVTALSNGNYVIGSWRWNGQIGAATWGNGSAGTVGAVSATNSLVGTVANDGISSDGRTDGITALANGNYVVTSTGWNNGGVSAVGAVTWGDGGVGTHGEVSPSNSLVGSYGGDEIGSAGVMALTNGNYVVRSPAWTNGSANYAGAVTWGNGNGGTVGPVSVQNSLVGTSTDDAVGRDDVTELANGNYVVDSAVWNNGSVTNAGAVTWGNGTTGITGAVSPANSLVGTQSGDLVGYGAVGLSEMGHVTALSNGNYVVASQQWANGSVQYAGAVTWADGNAGIVGPVSTSNSLVGVSYEDSVGTGVTPLDTGNYVVSSPNWSHGGVRGIGAVTWANGSAATVGQVSPANSLIGSSQYDNVGGNMNPPDTPWLNGVAALSNGNYVVSSPRWSNGGISTVGAITWGNGNTGIVGLVSSVNSVIGTTTYEYVGSPVPIALSNGNYVFDSSWMNYPNPSMGAITWRSGGSMSVGVVSTSNSLVGTQSGDAVGSGTVGISYDGIVSLANGNYAIYSPGWNNGAITAAGAVTLARGSEALVGVVDATNSVMGKVANSGTGLVYDYSSARDQLVVGRPAENIVTLLRLDLLFRNGFESP